MSLQRYQRKRRFDVTTEPRGAKPASRTPQRRFVIQQHDARRMHFDFRLELGGVLKSWAVPKGPSLSPKDKRLAVEVEDHPLEYRDFEGTIPEGEYGGGSVIVWDRGTWTPEGDAQQALREGHLDFSLRGEKTRGRYALIRMKGDRRGGRRRNWLLIKRADDEVREGTDAEITQAHPKSVISGRTVAEIGTKRSTPPLADLHPQLATLSETPPTDGGWVYEVKFDGYRALAAIRNGRAELRSRNGLDWTEAFPDITRALARLPVDEAVIDGEICAVDARGRTSFQSLQNAMSTRGKRVVAAPAVALVFFVFDLLFLDGTDFRSRPLLERKENLRGRLQRMRPGPIAYSDHVSGDGRDILAAACELGLEGVLAKQADAPYEAARSRSWLKLKCGRRQEFVIVGYVQAAGNRTGFRSLLLGVRDRGRLRYAGKVGTGFTQASLTEIARQLQPLERDTSALDAPPRERAVVWLEPKLVCEVAFTEITRDGSLRHPSFQGLRADKPARQVRRERAARGSDATPVTGETTVAGVRISHPERVMDTTSGMTKIRLARYYEHVAEAFLVHARNRPMALLRCPQGDGAECFFQKNAMAGLPPTVKRGRAADQPMLYVQDARGLLTLVQFNAIEFHGWGARVPRMRRPDQLVFDLDPDESLPFSKVVDAACEVRDALAHVDLQSFVKTTGGKGLHVVVPLVPEKSWDEVRTFARAVAEALAARLPERYVATMAKAKRKGKIFVDYLRNGEGATAVLPYSARARPGLTVAVPLAWKDLAHVGPQELRVDNVARWFDRRRRDPWAAWSEVRQVLPRLRD